MRGRLLILSGLGLLAVLVATTFTLRTPPTPIPPDLLSLAGDDLHSVPMFSFISVRGPSGPAGPPTEVHGDMWQFNRRESREDMLKILEKELSPQKGWTMRKFPSKKYTHVQWEYEKGPVRWAVAVLQSGSASVVSITDPRPVTGFRRWWRSTKYRLLGRP